MRIASIVAGLLALVAAPVLAEEAETSPLHGKKYQAMMRRLQQFNAEQGLWPPKDSDCTIKVVEGFQVALTPEGDVVTDPRDCEE